jgi:type II secretory ATPase GspE/PulE/Tfp pilus assembly ATPase PilB-like protein
MVSPAPLLLLAQLPESEIYVSPWKLALVVVWFVLWVLFAQWVDKDTVAVNTFRILWNLIVLGTGALAAALGLLLPSFAIAYPVFVLVNLTVMIIYVVHRNGLVQPADRVLTAEHFRRLREQGFSGKKKLKEVKERVRLIDSERKAVSIPEEEIPREMYRLTQDLMFDFFWRRAMVLELVPAGQVGRITYQVDGIAVEREPLPRQESDAVLQFLKQIAGLNREEKRKPQTGKITAALGDSKTEIGVRTDGSTAGEKLTLRVVGGEARFKVTDLGLLPTQLETLQRLMREVHGGLTVVSGPKANGASTTIFSITRSHDAFMQNIQMLEYTREVTIDNVTQHVFAPAPDKTFAAELQKLIRTDPDILIVPEVRDRESALLLARAAAEKQKIYVTAAAGDVFEALRKWLGAVGDKAVAARGLLAVMNQRLIRKLCTQCKQPYKPDAVMLKKLNIPGDKVLHRTPEPTYDKHGNPIICQACQGTGYSGRTGVFDILLIDDAMREVIRRSASFEDIQAHAKSKGAVGLQAQALQKVLDGETSIQEVVRVMKGEPSPSPAAAPAVRPKPRPQPQS